MSFDNSSPSFSHWQSTLASGSDKSSQGRANRPPQSVWGQPITQAGTRRGLTPLATSNLNASASVGSRRAAASSSPGPPNNATSPTSQNFPPLVNPNSRLAGSRPGTSASSSPAPLPSLQSGARDQPSFASSKTVTSPRPRTITPLPQLAGTTSTTNYSPGALGPGGGGGPGGGSRSGTYSPSPGGPNISSPTSFPSERPGNPPLSASSVSTSQSSLSKISVAQVLLLLDTISEKEGRAKWESKAEQIRKVRRDCSRFLCFRI